MKKVIALSLALAMLIGIIPAYAASGELTIMPRDEVIRYLELVNDYWITLNKDNVGISFWERGAYNAGNIEAYMITGIEQYREYSEKWAIQNNWKGHPNVRNHPKESWTWQYSHDTNSTAILFGDWQTCYQTYIDLYNFDVEKDPKKIANAKEVLEYQMSKDEDSYWWWADGLFMVMPVMAKMYLVTQDKLYLDKLYEYFTFAAELMYDGEEGIPTTVDGYKSSAYKYKVKESNLADPDNYAHLFYRDANYVFPAKPLPGDLANTKNFWARGNGWVFAAFAKILQDLPDNWEHYEFFKKIYIDFARAIKNCQKVDDEGRGFWTQSMLAHNYSVSDDNPWGYETSGTAFFTYGMLWGINAGILDRDEFLQPALRGWKYLTEIAIQEDGKVGYVQWVGGEAGRAAVYDNTQDFAVGAVLLAASEMARLSGGMEGDFYPYLQKRLVSTVSMKIGSPYMFADNKISKLDENNDQIMPIVIDGRTLVPVRVISEKFGAQVSWDGATQTINAKNKSSDITMQIGKNTYTVNGEEKALDVAPQIINDRTYIPLRAMAEALGKIVYYNDAEKVIVIGHKYNVFYECEENMLKMLSNMLSSGQYPERSKVEKVFLFPEFKDPALIRPVSATATIEPEDFNPIKAAVDFDINTRWASNVRGESITADLGEVKYVEKVGISFWRWDTRVTDFELYVSTDNQNFKQIFKGWSVPKARFDILDVNDNIRYIKIVGFGNNENEWTNVMEILAYGKGTEMKTNLVQGKTLEVSTSNKPNGRKIQILDSMIKASSEPEPHNGAKNAIDNDPNTYWAVQGVSDYVIDLGAVKNITSVGVGIRNYDDPNRQIKYTVTVSEDGKNYIRAGAATSPSGSFTYFNFEGQFRYVKITSNESGWASFAEFEVYEK